MSDKKPHPTIKLLEEKLRRFGFESKLRELKMYALRVEADKALEKLRSVVVLKVRK